MAVVCTVLGHLQRKSAMKARILKNCLILHKNHTHRASDIQRSPLRGHSQMTSAERGREGGYPITDAVREVA